MPNLFGIDIAGIVNTAMGPGFPDGVLKSRADGARVTGQLTAGINPDFTSYACKAIISEYTAYEMANQLAQTGDRKVLVLGASLPSGVVPAVGDEFTAEGTDLRVIEVRRDPAAAAYELKVRV